MTNKKKSISFNETVVFVDPGIQKRYVVPTLVNRASPLAAGTLIDMTLIVSGSIITDVKPGDYILQVAF